MLYGKRKYFPSHWLGCIPRSRTRLVRSACMLACVRACRDGQIATPGEWFLRSRSARCSCAAGSLPNRLAGASRERVHELRVAQTAHKKVYTDRTTPKSVIYYAHCRVKGVGVKRADRQHNFHSKF